MVSPEGDIIASTGVAKNTEVESKSDDFMKDFVVTPLCTRKYTKVTVWYKVE